MGDDFLEPDHDLYYRILLSINVGDRIRWKIDSKPTASWKYGTVTKMYTAQDGKYTKDSAYMMVRVETPNHHWKSRMAVHFDNPTIEKMVELEPYDTQTET